MASSCGCEWFIFVLARGIFGGFGEFQVVVGFGLFYPLSVGYGHGRREPHGREIDYIRGSGDVHLPVCPVRPCFRENSKGHTGHTIRREENEGRNEGQLSVTNRNEGQLSVTNRNGDKPLFPI